MIQLSIVYSVTALKVLPGQLFYLGIYSRVFFLKTVENSLPTPLVFVYATQPKYLHVCVCTLIIQVSICGIGDHVLVCQIFYKY